jgi:hypothetical protein
VALRREPRTSTRENPRFPRAEFFAGQHVLDQRREVSSIDASLTRSACKRSSCASEMASRSTPGVASGERTLCGHLSRISAARGSETVRSLRPRSISASEGGSRSRRLARVSRLNRAALRASSCVNGAVQLYSLELRCEPWRQFRSAWLGLREPVALTICPLGVGKLRDADHGWRRRSSSDRHWVRLTGTSMKSPGSSSRPSRRSRHLTQRNPCEIGFALRQTSSVTM